MWDLLVSHPHPPLCVHVGPMRQRQQHSSSLHVGPMQKQYHSFLAGNRATVGLYRSGGSERRWDVGHGPAVAKAPTDGGRDPPIAARVTTHRPGPRQRARDGAPVPRRGAGPECGLPRLPLLAPRRVRHTPLCSRPQHPRHLRRRRVLAVLRRPPPSSCGSLSSSPSSAVASRPSSLVSDLPCASPSLRNHSSIVTTRCSFRSEEPPPRLPPRCPPAALSLQRETVAVVGAARTGDGVEAWPV
jgi:hypothetical protein